MMGGEITMSCCVCFALGALITVFCIRAKTMKRYQRKVTDYTEFYQTLFDAELRTRK
jgi:hypothetical protein